MICICQVGHCDDACEACTGLHPTEPCPYDDGFAAVATCNYSTSIDRPCGRPLTSGQHCDFHAVLAQLDDFDFHDPTPIVVPTSVRPMVDRILSDVRANFDVTPRITPDTGYLLGLTGASMRRAEDLRVMRGDDR